MDSILFHVSVGALKVSAYNPSACHDPAQCIELRTEGQHRTRHAMDAHEARWLATEMAAMAGKVISGGEATMALNKDWALCNCKGTKNVAARIRLEYYTRSDTLDFDPLHISYVLSPQQAASLAAALHAAVEAYCAHLKRAIPALATLPQAEPSDWPGSDDDVQPYLHEAHA